MPSLKKLTKELRQEIVSYLFPFPTLSSNLAFRLATLIFAKTRFCSHINFIGRCLNSKVIPKGFRSNFHASTFSHSNQYLHQIRCAQNSFSRNIMRITIRAMCQKRIAIDKQILHCRSELSKICPAILVQSIRAKIRQLNSGLFDHLHQTKTLKLQQLIGPQITDDTALHSHNTVITIPENLPLTDSEKSVLSKGLNFVPITKRTNEFTIKQDVEKFLRRVQLKAFFHDKEDDSDTSNKDIFETLLVRKSKWTPPEGQFASLDFFTKKCRHDIHKLKFNRNTKFSNLSSEEWAALKNLSQRNDIVVKSADKGGAVVVWRSDLYQKEALRQLSDTSFYAKIPQDLTSKNQKLVKDTIQNLIVNQELPDTAKKSHHQDP